MFSDDLHLLLFIMILDLSISMDPKKLYRLSQEKFLTDVQLILTHEGQPLMSEDGQPKILYLHRIILSSMDYFKNMFDFDLKNGIDTSKPKTLEVPDVYLAEEIILSCYRQKIKIHYPLWLYFVKKIYCLDFFNKDIDPVMFQNIVAPPENFEDLLDLAEHFNYTDHVIRMLAKNIPANYDYSKLPCELLELMIKSDLEYQLFLGAHPKCTYTTTIWNYRGSNIIGETSARIFSLDAMIKNIVYLQKYSTNVAICLNKIIFFTYDPEYYPGTLKVMNTVNIFGTITEYCFFEEKYLCICSHVWTKTITKLHIILVDLSERKIMATAEENLYDHLTYNCMYFIDRNSFAFVYNDHVKNIWFIREHEKKLHNYLYLDCTGHLLGMNDFALHKESERSDMTNYVLYHIGGDTDMKKRIYDVRLEGKILAFVVSHNRKYLAIVTFTTSLCLYLWDMNQNELLINDQWHDDAKLLEKGFDNEIELSFDIGSEYLICSGNIMKHKCKIYHIESKEISFYDKYFLGLVPKYRCANAGQIRKYLDNLHQ